MIKILIISLFLFTQQAFSTVIPEENLTGAYANSGHVIEYINNEVEEPIETVNFILCFLKSLRSEAFLTQGDYQVWTQIGFCDQGEGNNTPYAKVVVNSTREDENSPQIVNARFRVEPNGANSPTIELTAHITAAPTVANPLGELTLYWTQVFSGTNTDNNDRGALKISNGRVESVIYDADGDLDEYISGDVANQKGSLYEVDNGSTVKKIFKFNDDYININTFAISGNSNTCYDRSLKTKTVWEYDIYTYDPSNTATSTVKFVPSTGGIKSFPFSYTDNGSNKFGYASYNYVYLEDSDDNPTTITNLSTDDEYTVVYNSSSNRFTSITGDNGSITIAPPVNFTIPSFSATDIRSGANPPTTSYVVNSDDISIYNNNNKRLSLKDGVLLRDSDNNQYVVKANFLETTFATTNSDACNGLTLTDTYAEPTIAVGDIVIDANGLSSIDNIDTVSVINGVIQ
ncbi:hypothetical protein SPONN_2667 [uncultured Candidatus Thioglobus sp.]|nr:hypothetical protein SPONN_2667 [uncultured Candidatus Thioglobus sp.]